MSASTSYSDYRQPTQYPHILTGKTSQEGLFQPQFAPYSVDVTADVHVEILSNDIGGDSPFDSRDMVNCKSVPNEPAGCGLISLIDAASQSSQTPQIISGIVFATILGMIAILVVTDSFSVPFYHIGPRDDLALFGWKLDTWPRWILAELVFLFLEIIDSINGFMTLKVLTLGVFAYRANVSMGTAIWILLVGQTFGFMNWQFNNRIDVSSIGPAIPEQFDDMIIGILMIYVSYKIQSRMVSAEERLQRRVSDLESAVGNLAHNTLQCRTYAG